MRLIISGGGTGGHIFPAIAIANKIREMNSSASILFVGALGKMEMEKVPEAGYNIVGLWISGFQRKLTMSNLIFPFKLLVSLIKAGRIIRKFKPDVVVGVGGFASGPVLFKASSMGIPTLIQEQNSYPGITNKILAKRVNRICVAYDGMEKFFPRQSLVRTGNPVRHDILSTTESRDEALNHFNLNRNGKTVLIIGGSLGSRTLNNCMAKGISDLLSKGFQVIWQTGKDFIEEAEAIAGGQAGVWTGAFIKRMDLAYSAADVVVSRAGAGTISELCIVGKPCILVPYPFAAEDHQTKNAMALVENEAAELIKDSEAAAELVPTLIALLNNSEKMKKQSLNLRSMAILDSAERIAGEIIDLSVKKK